MGNDCFSLIRCFIPFLQTTKKLPLLRVDSSWSFAGAKLLCFQEICNT